MIGGKTKKLLALGIGTITIASIYSRATLEENKTRTIKRPKVHLQNVMASYTSDFEPSIYWDYNWDRMEPGYDKKKRRKSRFQGEVETEDKAGNEGGGAKPEPEKPTSFRNIFLIRHGQYNLKGEQDVDRILTPLGRIQAFKTGLRLNQLARNYNEGKGFTFNSLIHSTMSRASETATIIHEMVLTNDPMTSDPNLIEGDPIPPEPPSTYWIPEQSYFKDNVRIETAFREYFHRAHVNQKEDSYDVIVCHGNVIRYFVCRALQLQPEAWLRFGIHNGSITWIRISPSGSVYLRMLGSTGHMDPELMTTT